MNCFLPLQQQWARAHGYEASVSMDGCPIHDLGDCPYDFGQPGAWLQHPPYSPDMHLLIEHRFAELKQFVVDRVYQVGFERCTVWTIRQFVLQFCSTITPQLIQEDLENLIMCYKIVAAPTTQFVTIGHESYRGVAGGWPPKRFR